MATKLELNRKRYNEKRERALAFLGGKCVECGSIEQLEFDHIIPNDKEYEIVYLLACRWERLEKELVKCQLLCRTCHIEKSRKDADVGHGGGAIGKTGCSCELCKERSRTYQNERNRMKRADAVAAGLVKRPHTVPHGGGKQGKRNCKCGPCTERRREYHRVRDAGRTK